MGSPWVGPDDSKPWTTTPSAFGYQFFPSSGHQRSDEEYPPNQPPANQLHAPPTKPPSPPPSLPLTNPPELLSTQNDQDPVIPYSTIQNIDGLFVSIGNADLNPFPQPGHPTGAELYDPASMDILDIAPYFASPPLTSSVDPPVLFTAEDLAAATSLASAAPCVPFTTTTFEPTPIVIPPLAPLPSLGEPPRVRHQTMEEFRQDCLEPQQTRQPFAAGLATPAGQFVPGRERRQTHSNPTLDTMGLSPSGPGLASSSPRSLVNRRRSLATSSSYIPHGTALSAMTARDQPPVSFPGLGEEPALDQRPLKRRKSSPKNESGKKVAAASLAMASNTNEAAPLAGTKPAPRSQKALRARVRALDKPSRTAPQPSGTKRVHLTEEQRRANHNNSEKKRRRLLARGFEGLKHMLPSVATSHCSKCMQLNAGADYLQELAGENEALAAQLRALTGRAEPSLNYGLREETQNSPTQPS